MLIWCCVAQDIGKGLYQPWMLALSILSLQIMYVVLYCVNRMTIVNRHLLELIAEHLWTTFEIKVDPLLDNQAYTPTNQFLLHAT